ncbi:MAG: hypothetical protein N3G76_00210 [Candidatus Micrarchaeota archaeon]|nr:hypothetical protein [Candidatus Micrarchaeota archaeon]
MTLVEKKDEVHFPKRDLFPKRGEFQNALNEFNMAAKEFTDANFLKKISKYFELKEASKRLDETARLLAIQIKAVRSYSPERVEEALKKDPLLQLALKIAKENEKREKGEIMKATPQKSAEVVKEVVKGEKQYIGTQGKLRGYYIDESGEVKKR